MTAPSVKLHHLYSVQFSDSCNVIIYDLQSVNVSALQAFLESPTESVVIMPGVLRINLTTKQIIITGHHIDNHTYLISKCGNTDHICIPYNCDNSVIITAIEYLYHMLGNILSDT